MVSPNEFWLNVHRLAESYEAEGPNARERVINVTEELKEMPLVTQQEVLEELLQIVTSCSHLYSLVAPGDAKNNEPAQARLMQIT